MLQRSKGWHMANELVRTFICIEITESIRHRIATLQQHLLKAQADVAWTKPAGIHLTLKFLGEVPQSSINKIVDAVRQSASQIVPFSLEVEGAGCFPNSRQPRVLWVGLKELPTLLKSLHASLERELETEGFQRDGRKFSPHLTIGRLRSNRNSTQLLNSLMLLGFEIQLLPVNQVVVMRSNLTPGGAVYTPISIIELKSAVEKG